jgi:hypothetical protein
MTTPRPAPDASTEEGPFCVPVPDGVDDLGPWALEELCARLGVEGDWSARGERAVTWWPGQLAVRMWADPPRATPAGALCRIHVETAVLRGVPVADPALGLLAAANLEAALAGLALEPDGTLSMHNAAYLHAEAPEEIELLGAAAALQVATCLASAGALQQALGGVVALASHPERGSRAEATPAAGAGRAIVEAGEAGSPFDASDFQAAEQRGARLWVVALANRRSLNAEIPFVSPAAADRPASRLIVPGADPRRGEGPALTALLQITADERHPDMGPGLLTLLRLPVSGEPDVVARAANELNLAERGDGAGVPLFGAWCTVERGLVFSLFTPAALCPPGPPEARQSTVLERVAWMFGRAMWAAGEAERRALVPPRRPSGIILPGGSPGARPGGLRR